MISEAADANTQYTYMQYFKTLPDTVLRNVLKSNTTNCMADILTIVILYFNVISHGIKRQN